MADLFSELAQRAGLTEAGTPRVLREGDFTASTQTANSLTEVASFTVPRNTVMAIDGSKPAHFKVRGHGYFASVAGGTPETFDLTTVGFASFTDGPLGDADNVIVLDNGSVVTPTAITYASASLTVDTTAGDNVDVYAYPGAGRIQLRAAPPQSGNTGAYETIFDDQVAMLDIVNQADAQYAPSLSGRAGGFVLGPLWQLQVYADAGYLIDWDEYSANVLIHAVMYRTAHAVDPSFNDFLLANFY